MATFKVGQRVRVVGQAESSKHLWGSIVGVEAVIHAAPYLDADCGIALAGDTRIWRSDFAYLAPLTDPKADAFIERVKSWKPEPVMPAPNRITTG